MLEEMKEKAKKDQLKRLIAMMNEKMLEDDEEEMDVEKAEDEEMGAMEREAEKEGKEDKELEVKMEVDPDDEEEEEDETLQMSDDEKVKEELAKFLSGDLQKALGMGDKKAKVMYMDPMAKAKKMTVMEMVGVEKPKRGRKKRKAV